MRIYRLLLLMLLALVMAAAGCCENPGAANQARQYLLLLQNTYYDASGVLKPQIKELAQYDGYVALGAVLADQGLALAGALQGQYCASREDLEQLQAVAERALKASPAPVPTTP